MVKKFTANCNFGSQVTPVTLYIGDPADGSHPLGFQSKWLGKEKGGSIPESIMDSFAKIADISKKSRVSFEELCSYLIEETNSTKSLQKDVEKASSLGSNSKKKGENK